MEFDLTKFLEQIWTWLLYGGSLGGVGYLAGRRRKADKKEDITDEKEQIIIDKLSLQLEAANAQVEQYRAASERVAQERNDAVKALGLLEGHLKGMEVEVHVLKEQIKLLTEENVRLQLQVRNMQQANDALRDQIIILHREMSGMTKQFAEMMVIIQQQTVKNPSNS